MSSAAMVAIAKHSGPNLGYHGLRVFIALFGYLDYENYIKISQAKLGEELGMARQHISQAIKKLVQENILLEGPKVGRAVTYRLNPHVGWRGKSHEHHKAVHGAPGLKNRMRQANIKGVIEGGTSALPPEMEQDRGQLALPLPGEE